MTSIDQVREFHVAMGAPVAKRLQGLTPARSRLRLSLILEEVGELAEALGSDGTVTDAIEEARAVLERDAFHQDSDLVEVADALGDIKYVVDGTAVEMCVPLDDVTNEIHRSNMSKVGGVQRADGKIGKGPNYRPPRIAEVLGLAPPFEYPAPCEGGFAQCDVAVSTAAFLDPKGRGAVNDKLVTVETGGSFVKTDSCKPRLDLLPRAAIEAMGRAFTYGAAKYAPNNWKLCDDPGRYVAAALRHLHAWNDGEERDGESGLSHLDHAIASMAMLVGLTAERGEEKS